MKMMRMRAKVCRLCNGEVKDIDYKKADILRGFITEKGKILPRRITGCCAKHQRIIAAAVKRSRHAALIPFEAE